MSCIEIKHSETLHTHTERERERASVQNRRGHAKRTDLRSARGRVSDKKALMEHPDHLQTCSTPKQ